MFVADPAEPKYVMDPVVTYMRSLIDFGVPAAAAAARAAESNATPTAKTLLYDALLDIHLPARAKSLTSLYI